MDVAIRDAMLPQLEAAEFFRRLRELTVSSIEIDVQPDDRTPFLRNDGGTYSIKDQASVRRLKRRLQDEGVRAAALLIATDFSSGQALDVHPEGAVRRYVREGLLVFRYVLLEPCRYGPDLGDLSPRSRAVRAE